MDEIIKAALCVEECFWKTFPTMQNRPFLLRTCIEDLRIALKNNDIKTSFDDDWVEKLKVAT